MICSTALAVAVVLLFITLSPASVPPTAWSELPDHGQLDHDSDRLGSVASASAYCSTIATDILKQKGNAVDAAIATEFCLSVVHMQWTGLGGGGFALVRSSNGSYEYVDFRETAPGAAYEAMYCSDVESSLVGGLASAVPGMLRGLDYLHRSYANLPWASLIAPSITLSRQGFRVGDDLASDLQDFGASSFLTQDVAWAIDFAPNGTLLGANDTMTRKRYADFLEAIAERGADAFYYGPFAQATVRAIQAANGTMTMSDLAQYAVLVRQPVELEYRDFRLLSCGAPGGGSVVLSVMNVAKGYEESTNPAQGNMSTHLLDESMRFGYGQRTLLGDPYFVEHIKDLEEHMLLPATAVDIRSRILREHTLPVSAYMPDSLEPAESHGTSHVVTGDKDGCAVSMTTTINTGFGSRVMVPETGLILNNEMNDFSIPGVSNNFGYDPSPANFIVPGKRPLSSMSPTIVELAGKLYFMTGAAGGSKIITSTMQSLRNVLDLNMSLGDSAAEPRFHDQLLPNQVLLEWTFNNATAAYLRDKGSTIKWTKLLTWVNSLRLRQNGTFEAASDPRQKDAAGAVA